MVEMTKEQIISYLTSPSSIGAEDIDGLREFSNSYPYSGIVQTLYLKGLHNTNSVYYENQLRTAAVTTSDRRKLYQLIHQEKLQSTIAKVIEEVEIDEPVEQPTEEAPATTELVKEDPSTELEEKVSVPEIDLLEQNILVEAINSSMHINIEEEAENLPQESKEEIKEEPVVAHQSFMDWFGGAAEKSSDEPSVSSLVDDYLNERTKEQPKEDKEFFSPQNLAKMSLVDNEDFVTETLAKVYVQQENFEKAIRIYEQLIVNYPEKKTFFASRIRFLKEKLENK